ncbi:MAG: MATE family efflux transporter [Ignavibacteriaceae bacterium]|nr:MATE family efflux transporter [Ignavibacteriaceae bacterium]
MPKKFFLTVTGASLIIIFFGGINKILGMFREIIFAHSFGLRQSYELYLLSIVIPTVINTFILYVGQNFFIPQYNKTKNQHGENDARIFFNKALALFFILSLLTAFALFLLTDNILKLFTSGLAVSEFFIAKKILQIILLTIPLNGLIAIISAYLQAEFDFKNAFVSQLFLNLSIIVVVLVFTAKYNIYSIPIGFFIGTLLQAGYLFMFARSKIHLQDLVHGKIGFFKEFPVQIFFITIFIELLGQLYIFIDRLFYSSVQQGGIAALNYATTVYLIPISILSMAFSTAIFPKFSETFSAGKIHETEDSFYTSLRITFFFFVPSAIVFIFYAQPVIEIFFHRGVFNDRDVTMTAEVLKIFGLSLVFFAAYAIINKLLFGIAAVKLLLLSSLTVIVIKITASLFLVEKYQQNGLAAASSLSYFFYFIFGMAIVLKKLHFKKMNLLFESFLLSCVNATVSFLVVELFSQYLFPIGSFISLLKICLFFIVYLVNALMIKDETMNIAKDLLTKTWKYIYE